MKRWLVLCLVAACWAPAAAMAGGSWFEQIETDLQAGDTVTMVGFSDGAIFNDDTVDSSDPFFAYLEVDHTKRTPDRTWPDISHDGVLPLGQMTTTRTGHGGWQTYRLHITFAVPDELEPGLYQFLHCNDPCTTGFGSLIGGYLLVGDPSPEELDAFYGDDVAPSDRGWIIDAADRNNPLVAELVAHSELALTGLALDLPWYGFSLLLIGTATLVISRRPQVHTRARS